MYSSRKISETMYRAGKGQATFTSYGGEGAVANLDHRLVFAHSDTNAHPESSWPEGCLRASACCRAFSRPRGSPHPPCTEQCPQGLASGPGQVDQAGGCTPEHQARD